MGALTLEELRQNLLTVDQQLGEAQRQLAHLTDQLAKTGYEMNYIKNKYLVRVAQEVNDNGKPKWRRVSDRKAAAEVLSYEDERFQALYRECQELDRQKPALESTIERLNTEKLTLMVALDIPIPIGIG